MQLREAERRDGSAVGLRDGAGGKLRTVQSLSYIDAWQMWFSGKQISGYQMLGIPILWWGRTGKIISILGGLTVLADIAGTERIAEMGRFIAPKNRILPALRDLLKDLSIFTFATLAWPIALLLGKRKRVDKLVDGVFNDSLVGVFIWFIGNGVAIASLFFGVWAWLRDHFPLWACVPLALYAFGIVLYSWILAVCLLLLAVQVAGWLISAIVLQPLANLLAGTKSKNVIQLVGIVITIIGFHFDLLAS